MKAQTPVNERGFTLIELLASVAILVIIVTMVGVIFRESDRAWTLGTNRAENNLAGRATLSMLSHDLQYAVADSMLTFAARKDRDKVSTYGFECDEVCFVSIQNDSRDLDADARRAAREIHYYVRPQTSGVPNRFELVRGYYSASIITAPEKHSYYSTTWYEGPSLGGAGRPGNNFAVARNVSGFAVYWEGRDQKLMNPYYSTANDNRLPKHVDICIELLNDREARQAADLWGRGLHDESKQFVKKNAVRHVTRVYFHNRDGYKERP